MTDPRIGTRNAYGSIATFPTQTLSGAPYSREQELMSKTPPALPGMIVLDAVRFVVLDRVQPADFDRNAAVDELRGSLSKPAPATRKVTSESEAVGG